MTQTENHEGISAAADFFTTMQAVSAETVKLPSGLTVVLARPSTFGTVAIQIRGRALYKALAEADPAHPSEEPAKAFVKWVTSLFQWAFVLPQFSAEPERGEIGIENIVHDDLTFIVRWLGGLSACADTGAQKGAPKDSN